MHLLYLVGAGVLALLVCCASRQIGQLTQLVDRPDGVRKLHPQATPLVGGLAVLVPSFSLTPMVSATSNGAPHYLAVAVMAGLAAMILGAADDRFNVNAWFRLATLAVAAMLAMVFDPTFMLNNLRLDALGVKIPLGVLAGPLTVLALVGFVNACNMADGINGQFLGSTIIWSLLLAWYAEPSMRIACLTIAVCAAVALTFNLKGSLFSGSAGTYGVPMFLGLNAIALYHRADGAFHEEIPALWFWLPVADCLRLFAWRMVKRRSPLTPDRNHLHHVLLEAVGPRLALPVYLAMLALPGVAALVYEPLGVAMLVLCLAIYAIIFSPALIRITGAVASPRLSGVYPAE